MPRLVRRIAQRPASGRDLFTAMESTRKHPNRGPRTENPPGILLWNLPRRTRARGFGLVHGIRPVVCTHTPDARFRAPLTLPAIWAVRYP
jgi:hypothetical protein